MKQTFKNRCGFIAKCLMIFALIFSMMTSYGLKDVHAETGQFVVGRNIKYPRDWDPENKAYSTHYMTYNGKVAYCIEASKKTPSSGSFGASVYSNENLLKVLYYGFGGTGEQYAKDHGIQYANDDDAYLNTHIMASYAYCGDTRGINTSTVAWHLIFSRYTKILSMPNPNQVPITIPVLNASYDPASDGQRTNTVRVNGTELQSASIALQSGVTCHNVTTGAVTQGVANLKGGDEFYLTSTNENTGSWTSEKAGISGIKLFEAVGFKFSDSTQAIATLNAKDPTQFVNMSVQWLDYGKLHLIKTQDTGKLLDGAEFSLKSISFEGFEKTLVVKDGEIIADHLPVGKYMLQETKTPDSYFTTKEVFEVEIRKDETTRKIVVNRLNPKGKIVIKKNWTGEIGSTNFADEKIAKFQLSASEDIYSALTLEKLYSKDEVVKEITIDGDKDTEAIIEDLPMGKYQLRETECSDGYAYDKEVKDIEFRQENFETKVYEKTFEFNNALTTTEIHKVDENGTLLKGAKLQVTDENGKVIDSFTTGKNIIEMTDEIKNEVMNNGVYEMEETDEDKTVKTSIQAGSIDNTYKVTVTDGTKTTHIYTVDVNGDEMSHKITGLIAGAKYTLSEVEAPKGYATAKDQTFEAGADVDLNMIDADTKVEVSKKDITNNKELEGASLKVTDKDGKVIDEWVSTKEAHMIKNLEAGKTYTLTEVIAPDGYSIAQSIDFTVADTGDVQKVTMYDELLPASGGSPKTGDDQNNALFDLSATLAGLAIVIAGMVRSSSRKKKSN